MNTQRSSIFVKLHVFIKCLSFSVHHAKLLSSETLPITIYPWVHILNCLFGPYRNIASAPVLILWVVKKCYLINAYRCCQSCLWLSVRLRSCCHHCSCPDPGVQGDFRPILRPRGWEIRRRTGRRRRQQRRPRQLPDGVEEKRLAVKLPRQHRATHRLLLGRPGPRKVTAPTGQGLRRLRPQLGMKAVWLPVGQGWRLPLRQRQLGRWRRRPEPLLTWTRCR